MGLKKGYCSKKRNSNNRKRKSIFFISTEGKNKTEELYFKKFNNRKVTIHFPGGRATDPENMIDLLINECKNEGFNSQEGDKAFCLIDSDFSKHKNKQIEKADIKAKTSDVELIVSSPCFEIWYICHFSYSTKQYLTNSEVIEEIKKHIPKYKKSVENMYELLLQKQDIAIKNAKKLEDYNLNNGKILHTVEFMPSTEVYKIIE